MSVEATEVNFKNIFGWQANEFIYQDDQCVVFDETRHPQAPVHFLVVPRRPMPRICDAGPSDERLLGHLLRIAHAQAGARGLTCYHVSAAEDPRKSRLTSVHVFSRALHHMLWPTGPGYML